MKRVPERESQVMLYRNRALMRIGDNRPESLVSIW